MKGIDKVTQRNSSLEEKKKTDSDLNLF